MLQFKTIIMFLVVVLVTAGTYFALEVMVDRSEQVEVDTGATADEVFGATQPATIRPAPSESASVSDPEQAIREIAQATARAAAARTATAVARDTVADQL